jgi:hypothetical protein
MDQSASPTDHQPRNPPLVTRLLYALGAFSLIPATLVGSSSWIGLATGGTFVGQFGVTTLLLMGAAILFRVYQILRYPRALEIWPSGWVAKSFRGLALGAMLVGGLAGIGLFMIRPITSAVMQNPGGDGIGFFVVGLYLVIIAGAGWKGCVVYEIARLARRPSKSVRPPSPFRWKQDVIVAAVLVAVCVGLPAFQRVTAPPRCEGIRIACVATIQADVTRMIARPLGTPVQFESSVKQIDLRSGSKWALSENPGVSLKASGYPPTIDANATVRVKVDAAESPDGVLMHLLVYEGSQQTARFTIAFARGSKLERDAQGATHVAIEAPSNIDSMITVYHDGRSSSYMVDQIYVLLRQAIGTEQEARENSMRLLRTARTTSQIEGDVEGASAKARWSSDAFDARCAGLVAVNSGGAVRSTSVANLGAPTREVRFTRSQGAVFPETNMDVDDRVICEGGNVLILSYRTANPLFSLRRYSEDGKLLRFVQSQLPKPKEGYDFIDIGTLRETANAITFDRVRAQFRHGKETFVRRESFEVPF